MGVWTDFASCLVNAMRLIEGQAYAPEIKRDSWDKGKFNLVYPEMGSILDDGTESGKAKDRKPLDATIIGQSDYAQGVRDKLFGGKFIHSKRLKERVTSF